MNNAVVIIAKNVRQIRISIKVDKGASEYEHNASDDDAQCRHSDFVDKSNASDHNHCFNQQQYSAI